MENKYYTPDISDIRVGYECEVESNLKWKHITLTAINSEENHINSNNGNYWLTGQNLRVSYLTKEQLIVEGWIIQFELPDGRELYRKYNFRIEKKNNRIHIFKIERTYDTTLFVGNCLSINEFRFICKLLNI
jgi:hypothetical protein